MSSIRQQVDDAVSLTDDLINLVREVETHYGYVVSATVTDEGNDYVDALATLRDRIDDLDGMFSEFVGVAGALPETLEVVE